MQWAQGRADVLSFTNLQCEVRATLRQSPEYRLFDTVLLSAARVLVRPVRPLLLIISRVSLFNSVVNAHALDVCLSPVTPRFSITF